MTGKHLHTVLSQGISAGANLQLWAVSELTLAPASPAPGKATLEQTRNKSTVINSLQPILTCIYFFIKNCFQPTLLLAPLTSEAPLPMTTTQLLPYRPRREGPMAAGGFFLAAFSLLPPACSPPVFLLPSPQGNGRSICHPSVQDYFQLSLCCCIWWRFCH